MGRGPGKLSLHLILTAYSWGWACVCAQEYRFRQAGCVSLRILEKMESSSLSFWGGELREGHAPQNLIVGTPGVQ